MHGKNNSQKEAILERQIDEITEAIAQAKADRGERYTIKQMEKSKKQLMTRLDKLNDQSRKDNVVTFEQLGVDRLFVDESHSYKNLFLYTKMRNVAGIAQTEARKSQDMFNKCQYLDELTGGKDVTFATGTPISNSMTELYTNMRYLQYGTLQKLGLGQFDAWAANFGDTQTAIELAPEGTGYRAKTRFAKFFNLPELIALFKESADIQTPDMLKLPVPEAEYENVTLKPSEAQKRMVESLADRAERVRNRMVDSSVDNMLKITNDGRKLALDQRLMNDMLPDDENSKSSVCVEKAFEIWEETKDKRSAQLIFCDLSTPKGDGTFNVYEDIRDKLIAKGVPPEEIAFIHDANTETRKAELFGKVRSGQVRFLLGSTQKMGAGTNVQDRLIALHHLDVPWRPSEEGHTQRYIRQKPSKINEYRAIQQPTMTCRYRVGGSFFVLTISGYTITMNNVVLYAKLSRKIMLEGYATVQEMAEKWGLNERTVQTMCATGRIEGLAKFGRSWAIPKDTEKPTDNRVKSGAYKDWRKKNSKSSEETGSGFSRYAL